MLLYLYFKPCPSVQDALHRPQQQQAGSCKNKQPTIKLGKSPSFEQLERVHLIEFSVFQFLVSLSLPSLISIFAAFLLLLLVAPAAAKTVPIYLPISSYGQQQ